MSFIVAAVIGGTAAVAGGVIAAKGASDAADKNAEGIANAQGISADAAKRARQDVLNSFGSGYDIIAQAIEKNLDLIASGKDTTTNILTGYSQEAANILSQTGTSVESALLGVTPPQPRLPQPETQQPPTNSLSQTAQQIPNNSQENII